MLYTFKSYAFGCRVNQAEKEALDAQLINLGCQYSEENPDLYIINTCAVTAKAEREARQHVYQIRRKWPKTRIIVTGCAGTKWMKSNASLKEIDCLIPNSEKVNLASYINSKFKSPSFAKAIAEKQKSKPNVIAQNQFNNTDKFLRSKRMFVKIQDGCQKFCTYCIVPYLRGKPKSEKIKDIVKKIKAVEKNLVEVILTAINTEAYGLDTGEKLTDLISEILSKTSIRRLSFGSINPWSIDDAFIKLYETLANNNRFVHFFHIPIQSGSDDILKLMKRDYKAQDILGKLTEIKKNNPYAQIGTDIIAGFPGETIKDFQDTYKFLQDAPIDKFHVFRFSPREGTAAWFMRKKYPELSSVEKNTRAKALIALGQKKYQAFLDTLVGKTMEAFIIHKNRDGSATALLENQVPVTLKSASIINNVLPVIIDSNNNGAFTGKIVSILNTSSKDNNAL